MLAVFTVNSMLDNGDGANTTLREAVDAAVASLASEDTIKFDPTVFASGGTILLTGQLNIDETTKLTIDGTNASGVPLGITINGNDPSGTVGNGNRIFNITDPTFGTTPPLVVMKSLTLTGADPSQIGSGTEGGAIRSEARLELRDMEITGNRALEGAAVYLAVAGGDATERIILSISEGSILDDNSATERGGAVSVRFSSAPYANDTVRIEDSVITGNMAGTSASSGYGGAMYIGNDFGFGIDTSHAVIASSTVFHDNMAGKGGAIFHASGLGTRIDLSILAESSITGNQATGGEGGGIHSLARYESEVRIEDSTISEDNTSTLDGGGVFIDLEDDSSLHIEQSVITDNHAGSAGSVGSDGGGVFAIARKGNGTSFPTPRAITILESLVSGNTAQNRGGGMYIKNFEYTEALIEDTQVTGNTVPSGSGQKRNGGGIYAFVDGIDATAATAPKITISRSTVDNNKADHEGGGIFVCGKIVGVFVMTNSTISGNEQTSQSAGGGGGMFIARESGAGQSVDAYLRNVTVTKNSSRLGGGVGVVDLSDVRVRIANSIISENVNHSSQANNLVGRVAVDDFLHNLIGNGSSILDHTTGLAPVDPLDSSNILNQDDPGLDDLADYGGPTPTHALLQGSPAIDEGSNALAEDPLTDIAFTTDQRGAGFQRPFDVPFVNNNANDFTVDIGAYEMSLAFLPGDYDRNGAVECYDYLLWRATFGHEVPAMGGADGNGNGIVDAADYTIWADHFDENAGNPIGDFNDDGATNMADYLVWYATFGSTTDHRADANCNGVVDASDYTIWRDTFASAIGSYKFGLLVSAFDTDLPPSVVGVGLGASAGGFHDFVLAVGSGEQLRSVPLESPNSLSITFTQAVTVTQNDLVIENLDGTSPTVSSFAYDGQAQTATWTFTSSLADGRHLVRLSDAVENDENEALDGDFDNPWSLTETGTSELASGNGAEGEEFRFRFTVLAGDTDHDNIDGATNYENWKSYEPGMIYASSTSDEYDADLTFGDVSLREAVDHANTAGVPTAVDLKSGTYNLTITGSGGISQGDLDITGNVTIVGDGPGISIIDAGAMSDEARHFDVANLGVLNVRRATLQLGEVENGTGPRDGGAVRVQDGGQLHMDYSAIVGNFAGKQGDGAIYFAPTGSGSIRNSVITVNETEVDTAGVHLEAAAPGSAGAVIVGNSIIAKNNVGVDVYAGLNRSFTSEGNNRLGNATTGFTNGVNGDYVGTPNYIVTTLADTYDGSSDPVGMSIRDAIHQANITAGAQEIWLPAWDFVLTRDRATYGSGTTDMDVAFGDLDITGSLTIRGMGTVTSVGWAPGVVDRVFELVGDYNGDGTVNAADQTVWNDTQGATPDPGEITADGDDDGDIDEDDEDVWTAYFGYTLALFNVSVPG